MTNEEKIQMRKDVLRLYKCDTIGVSKDMLFILSDCLIRIMYGNRSNSLDRKEIDAKLVCQMIFSKSLHVRKLLDGVGFKSSNQMTLNNVIDPTIIGLLVRNIYETVAMFNVVYVQTTTAEEKETLYNLWVIAGLKYRQRFDATQPPTKQKQADEANDIMRMTKEIEQTSLYKSLDTKSAEIIKECIKQKDFKIQFNNNSVKKVPWAEIKMGIKEVLINKIYTYLSLHAHPSNVSVFQFRDFFQLNDPQFIETSNFQIRYAIIITSTFIRDYIEVFPNSKIYFDELPLINQLAINLFNVRSRNDAKGINHALDLLN